MLRMSSGGSQADSRRAMDELRRAIRGEVREDRLTRALYATDASIYEIVPDGVIFPRSVEDVQTAVRICAEHRLPVTARGAGTGLAGGAVNRGLQLDCSRYLNRVLHIDPVARTAVVEPGVVLDELNAALASHGLHFAPDVATSSRATIGGMIANNSCGAHSVMYGRTVDHVVALDLVLADGSRQTWGATSKRRNVETSRSQNIESSKHQNAGRPKRRNAETSVRSDLEGGPQSGFPFGDHIALGVQCEVVLRRIADEYSSEIVARFPKVIRRNGGYALDRLRVEPDGGVNVETLICGSEGTLAIVVGAVLNLVPLPKHRGLVVAHFNDLLDALTATSISLEHNPAAVELLDKLILDAARDNPVMRRRRWLIEGDPQGVLIIELHDEDAERLAQRLGAAASDLKARGMGYAWPILTDPVEQDDIWYIRKSGLGLLMSRPGDRQTYDFVEDTAVDPARLRDYIARFIQVLDEEGVTEASYYAHASVGCLHVKPVLNLKSVGDIRKMHRIADRISSLALEFGGTMTGEHGDGILRSCWLEKMYGPRIIEAFRKVKAVFDPHNILNPGKIVDPLPMLENFRYGPAYQAADPLTVLDFSAHGGMAGLAEMCSGVGQCRQRLVGTMCPSYMATGDERHTTRARANALRMALSNRNLLDGLEDPALSEVMDLCLSCKACKSECPTGVDMARLKAEWQHHHHQHTGAPLRSRLIEHTALLCRWASRAAPLANAIGQNRWVRSMLDRWLDIDRRVPPPRLAEQTFRNWLKQRRRQTPSLAPRNGSGVPEAPNSAFHIPHTAFDTIQVPPRVAYFIDTWTNYFTPDVGIATVRVLEALGYEVIIPPQVCCGRPAISKGLLDYARSQAQRCVEVLAPIAEQGIPILGTEPSCILTFTDELPQLVRTPEARRIANHAMMLETFLARDLVSLSHRARNFATESKPDSSACHIPHSAILYHSHCHQKALVGADDAIAVLRSVFGDLVSETNSGCCGMAGSFGHEKEHYEVAAAIGEQRLFPTIRKQPAASIAVSGFSCRQQIEHHTGAAPRHLVELLADRLVACSPADITGPFA